MIVLPSDPAHPAHHGFTTTRLFASGKLDDAAALNRALQQFFALCDEQRLWRPTMPKGIQGAFPCWLVVTVRQHRTTHKQVGRLQLRGADGDSSLTHHWPVAQPGAPAMSDPLDSGHRKSCEATGAIVCFDMVGWHDVRPAPREVTRLPR